MKHQSIIEPVIGHVSKAVGDWTGKATIVATVFVKAQIYLADKTVNDVLNYILTGVSIVYVLVKIANELKRRKIMDSDHRREK